MEKNSAHLAETEFRGLGLRRSGYNSPVVWSLATWGGVWLSVWGLGLRV